VDEFGIFQLISALAVMRKNFAAIGNAFGREMTLIFRARRVAMAPACENLRQK
jgi:hypothetical protein